MSSSCSRLQITRTPSPLRSKRKCIDVAGVGDFPAEDGAGKLRQQRAHDQEQFFGLGRDVVAVVADGEGQGKVDPVAPPARA